jgi:hypothetical protein
MSTHVYISEPNVFIQKIWAHWPVPHHGTTKPAHQPNQKWYTHVSYNQGASKAPPAAPPSGGGGGPPLPAPGGGGGTSAGPPCPGGRRPLVIAASTAARRMIDRHGGGNPTHCSRNSSSWIWIHMRSGTSRRTVSKRRTISSSTPAAAGGACDGPAPGSSQRRLCAGLSVLLLPQQPHPSDASHPAVVCPAQAAPVPGPCPPPAHEVLHLHKHQTNNKQRY